jgi:hypothetical protein
VYNLLRRSFYEEISGCLLSLVSVEKKSSQFFRNEIIHKYVMTNFKINLTIFFILMIVFRGQSQQDISQKLVKDAINHKINRWHKAAAKADFKTYFDLMSEKAVFVGTDSSEVWSKKAFMKFAKPYFDKGKAWHFKPLNRHIYTSETHPDIAWFDETLDTWMGVCRGSGVLIKDNGHWLIKHYVLSLTVPNNQMNAVIKLLQSKAGQK